MKKEKWDFELKDKEIIKILKDLEKWINKNFGRRCKTKASGCFCCQIWLMYDLLKSFLIH